MKINKKGSHVPVTLANMAELPSISMATKKMSRKMTMAMKAVAVCNVPAKPNHRKYTQDTPMKDTGAATR